MTFRKLVIAGSTGYVADHAIRAILASEKPKFDVTVLTRIDSGKTELSISGARMVPIDYSDHAALVRAVAGADAILSFISGPPSKAVDLLLLRAAQEAGVRRIFPSEYTLDVLHPAAAALLTDDFVWPDNTSPVAAAEAFTALVKQGGPTSFTTILSSAFIDFWLEGDFGSFDPKNHKVTVLDGGDKPFTGCSLPYLADAIVAVLQMDEEKTKNKRIAVSEVRTTMNDITEMYEEVTGVEFERLNATSRQELDQRKAQLEAGQPFQAMFTTIHLTAFNGCGAADLKDGLAFKADGFLTAPQKTLKELVTEAVKKVASAS